jgi:DNA replication protein DnaC
VKAAKLRSGAVVEDVDFSKARGLDKTSFLTLVNSPWVSNHQGVMIVGPTGVGMTFVACALASSAIFRGHSALYMRVPRPLDHLSVVRIDGRLAYRERHPPSLR